jgi:hypothetical protein
MHFYHTYFLLLLLPLLLLIFLLLLYGAENMPVVQLLKNFPAFYGMRRFITVFTRALHWSLS